MSRGGRGATAHATPLGRAYSEYSREFPDSPYAKEAEQRQEDVRAWDLVDKSDPIAIHLFLLGGPFDALRIVAEASVRTAIDAARTEHRREFWRHVGIPFYVLFPLFPLVYVVIFGVGTGFYELAGHPKVAALFGSVEGRIVDAAASYGTGYLGPAAAFVRVVASYVAEAARLVITVVGVIAVWGLFVFVVSILQKGAAPRVRKIEHDVDEGSASAFEAVV